MEPPKPAEPGTLGRRIQTLFGRAHVVIYRASGGRIGGKFPGGAPVMLLDHVGRKSGTKRTTPLLYGRQGDSVLIIASSAGSKANPAWFYNLRDTGECAIQIGSERSQRKVRVLEGEERAAAWEHMNTVYKEYDLYQERAGDTRQIPVLSLDPS